MRYLIIGNSAAGVTAAEAIRSADHSGEITIVADETHPAYSRIFITNIVAGTARWEDILMRPPDFYQRLGIKTVLGQRAVGADLEGRTVYLENGEALIFDRLLLATGASPQLPRVPGSSLEGVTGMRTMADALKVMKILDEAPGAPVVVLGGGLVSLKSAEAMARRGGQVLLVVKSRQILSQMLDEKAAAIIQKRMERAGIKITFGYDVSAFTGRERLEGIHLENGEEISSRLAIIAKGVVPNTDLAKSMGLQVNKGIVVDAYQRTNSEVVYAAGDVCETYDPLRQQRAVNAMWPNAVFQGAAAGANMAGAQELAHTGVRVNAASFFGLQAASVGWTRPREGDEEVTVLEREENYLKFIFRQEHLVGAVLVGDIRNIGYYRWLVAEEKPAGFLRREGARKVYNFSTYRAKVWADLLKADSAAPIKGGEE
ncbi:FAD-dependent oxidoreductase [Moorella naiadis]|uniref:NAD(P)/FAD-dependent oxidoreductase n=1 Tax=Moorella naiadis (nom. illeg.) TaxID=3093670 RepID=UPI003D9C972F